MIITSENYSKYLDLQTIYDKIKELEYSEANLVELVCLFKEAVRIAAETNNKFLSSELAQTESKHIDTMVSPELEWKYLEMKFNDAKIEIKADLRRYGRCED